MLQREERSRPEEQKTRARVHDVLGAPPSIARAPAAAAAVARLVAEQREIRARHAQRLQIDPPEVDFFDGYVPVRPTLQPTPLLRPY